MSLTTDQIKTRVQDVIFQMGIGLMDINDNNFCVIVQVCRDYEILDWLEDQQEIIGIPWKTLINDYKDIPVNQ